MSCCEESDGNLTECPGYAVDYQYQDSAHSQIVLLSLIISLWVFSIVQFLRFDCSPESARPPVNHSLQRIFRVALAGAVLWVFQPDDGIPWGWRGFQDTAAMDVSQSDFPAADSSTSQDVFCRYFSWSRIVLQDINSDTNLIYLKEPPDLHLIPSWGVPPRRGFLPPDIRSDLRIRSPTLVSAECRHPREGMTYKISPERFSTFQRQ